MENVISLDNIINDINTREQLIDRVEVLDKVKALLLMPGMTFTTMQSVANYYDVSYDAIKSIVQRNREELNKDGLLIINKKTFLEDFYKGQDAPYKVESTKASVTAICEDGPSFVI